MYFFGVSGAAYAYPSASEVPLFCVDIQLPAPELPPRVRCSTSMLHWKEPPPSPPVEHQTTSSVFTDSMVCDFFAQSKHSTSPHGVGSDQPFCYTDSQFADGNLVPCTSSSSSVVISEAWRDRSNNQYHNYTQADDHRFDMPAESGLTGYPAPAYSNVCMMQPVVGNNGLFQTGNDASLSSCASTDINSIVTAVNGDSLSASRRSLAAQGEVAGALAEDTHSVGLWKQFDKSMWHVEQEKLKQMSLDLPAESDTADDQVPDLSSSNRLSVAALRLYDSIYSAQLTGSAHHAQPVKSLSSVWMREQNASSAAHTTDKPVSCISVQKSERGPCAAIHRAVEAERHTKFSNTYGRNVCESDVGNSASSSTSYLPQSQQAQQMFSAQQMDGKYAYASRTAGGGAEAFVPTDSLDVRLAAEANRELRLSGRENYDMDSSYSHDCRWQISADVPQSDVSHTDVEDTVLVRRPSIKELKSRFEAEASGDSSIREAAEPPSFSVAGRRQFETSSLKVGRRGFHTRTGSESGETSRQKPTSDARNATVSPYVDKSSKNYISKGRFVTRASIAANAVVNLPVLPNDANIELTESRQFERLVDRRKVFEAADTQPVA